MDGAMDLPCLHTALDDRSAANLTAMGMPRIWSRTHYRFNPTADPTTMPA
jgi:hypothetical protein